MTENGRIVRVSGPVVTAEGISARMYDLVLAGNDGLMGEVIKIVGDNSVIQVYEDTSNVRPGEPVKNTGQPLSVELGPGLLGQIYDGIQRPLPKLMEKMGDFIKRGVSEPGLSHTKKYHFIPSVKKGVKVSNGDTLGYVQETKYHRHYILANVDGKELSGLNEGDYTIDDPVGSYSDGMPVLMYHKWPVRTPRPYRKKMAPYEPLVTGQRIFDTFFPVAKGGTAAIPGPFGSGKTVSQHQLAKWSDSDIVVYVGCGERGNEMTEVLTEFPELQDPKTGSPLMDRTVLIANTSNMPVAAREASVYTGITFAEYFRDMGYNVSLMADSTSRWAEAMREISSRLEEMPGEEGFPAYLSARLSTFYERAGVVQTMSNKEASVTVIGAVSPPGGDFSEPVTQNTLRIVKVFWALDAKLAQRRHFPSVNWLTSYTLYTDITNEWFNKNVSPRWSESRQHFMTLLQKEAELQEIVQLVGSDALPPDEQLTLEIARMIREILLQQNAFHEVDSYCSIQRQMMLNEAIIEFENYAKEAVAKEIAVESIASMKARDLLSKARFEKNFEEELKKAMEYAKNEFASMGVKV